MATVMAANENKGLASQTGVDPANLQLLHAHWQVTHRLPRSHLASHVLKPSIPKHRNQQRGIHSQQVEMALIMFNQKSGLDPPSYLP
jgi:hypothetical protein